MSKAKDSAKADPKAATGFLATVERVGNMVPHPAIIFFLLIAHRHRVLGGLRPAGHDRDLRGL